MIITADGFEMLHPDGSQLEKQELECSRLKSISVCVCMALQEISGFHRSWMQGCSKAAGVTA